MRLVSSGCIGAANRHVNASGVFCRRTCKQEGHLGGTKGARKQVGYVQSCQQTGLRTRADRHVDASRLACGCKMCISWRTRADRHINASGVFADASSKCLPWITNGASLVGHLSCEIWTVKAAVLHVGTPIAVLHHPHAIHEPFWFQDCRYACPRI